MPCSQCYCLHWLQGAVLIITLALVAIILQLLIKRQKLHAQHEAVKRTELISLLQLHLHIPLSTFQRSESITLIFGALKFVRIGGALDFASLSWMRSTVSLRQDAW